MSFDRFARRQLLPLIIERLSMLRGIILSVHLLLALMIIFLVLDRYVVRGLTFGSVKR